MHKCDLIMDFQYGSTGKGLLAGYLAKRGDYDTAICSFATNAGHTYIDGDLKVMTQQLPTAAVVSKTVRYVLLGPGSLIHIPTLKEEMARYAEQLRGKNIIIHPQAAIVTDEHAALELCQGMAKIGSTTKGVGEAAIQRIRRDPTKLNTAGSMGPKPLLMSFPRVWVDTEMYEHVLCAAESVIVEGAQGFSLSMYHGQYPYTTSRDVTPWQIAADCGLPFRWVPYVKVHGTLRTFPIRVNNREGSSGPCYPDQRELSWEDIGVQPELTTVTKLPRRVFSFSVKQLQHAMLHCAGYWETKLFLNFANYMKRDQLAELVKAIETPRKYMLNAPKVAYLGFGPDDGDVATRAEYDHWA